jgi:hypothetical protein
LALLLGLSTAVAWAADRDEGKGKAEAKAESARTGWFRRKARTEPAKPKVDAKSDKRPVEAEAPKPQVETAGQQRQQEQEAMLRRLAVCDELNRIAMETQDQDLMRKVNQLTQRTMATYSQRTAHLPASNVRFESDEKILEKHLGAGTAVAPRQTGSPPYSYKGPDRQTAARGEVDE